MATETKIETPTSEELPDGPGVRVRLAYAVNIEEGSRVLANGQLRRVVNMTRNGTMYDILFHDGSTASWRFNDLICLRA